MQPACFARAQVRPARRGPPTGDYTATTLRPGSPHSKQQKPLPSRRQQERFSPLAKGNPLRCGRDRFGKADLRSTTTGLSTHGSMGECVEWSLS
jgi:hypothetical protein